jgi:hypothetical protein
MRGIVIIVAVGALALGPIPIGTMAFILRRLGKCCRKYLRILGNLPNPHR